MGEYEGPQSAAIIGARILDRLPQTAPLVTARIRATLVEYQVVPLQDHVAHVLEQQSRLVQALMDSRSPDADDLARAAALGRLRASQGVSVEAVLGAFHIGNSALWDAFVEEAGDNVDILPRVATLMWASLEVMSTAITAAHSSVSRSRQVRELTIRQRFLELLAVGDAGPELHELAVALGFRPEGSFVVAVARTRSDDGSDLADYEAARVGRGLVTADLPSGAASWTRLGQRIAVVAQGALGEEAVARLRDMKGIRIGIGLMRPRLVGAAASLIDANRSLAITSDARPVAEFQRDWLTATVVADVERLEPVVAPHLDVIRGNTHLVDALECFVEARGSITAAARLLHVHPNTVIYRLERWTQLTGWDPRAHGGLSDSMIAIALIHMDAGLSQLD